DCTVTDIAGTEGINRDCGGIVDQDEDIVQRQALAGALVILSGIEDQRPFRQVLYTTQEFVQWEIGEVRDFHVVFQRPQWFFEQGLNGFIPFDRSVDEKHMLCLRMKAQCCLHRPHVNIVEHHACGIYSSGSRVYLIAADRVKNNWSIWKKVIAVFE